MITLIKRITEKYVALAQDPKVPFRYFVLTVVAIISLRNFIEVFSDRFSALSFPLHFHYYVFYVCVALNLIFLFSATTGEGIAKTTRLILFSFFFILLTPILDLIISGGKGFDIAYFSPTRGHGDLLLRYLTLTWWPFEGDGVTIGIKIESSVMLIVSFIYFKFNKVSTLKSLFSVLLFYTALYLYAITPFIIKAMLDVVGLFEGFNDMLYYKFYLPLMFVFLLMVAWRWNKQYVISIFKDMRPFRQVHALVMFAFGIVLGPGLVWNQYTPFDLILVALATFWGCLFVIMTNNLEDQEIDQMVNKTRPLVSGAVPRDDYQKLAWVAGLLALIYAVAVSYHVFFTVLLSMGLYSVYSLPPIKLKRVPFFSKIVIAINSLAYAIMGYVFAGGEAFEFPPLVILWFVVFFTAAMNFIDIKDYEGDKQVGIKTLPVIWGLRESQYFVGLCFFLAYVAAPFAVGQMILLIPAIGAGVAQYWLVSRNKYQEKWVFALYLVSFVVLLACIVFTRYYLAAPH